MAPTPTKVTLFAYQVGFGDCFLLRFTYPGEVKRHVLIDFGSFPGPRAVQKHDELMLRIGHDIKEKCGEQLDAVVATHRHKDHVSGFATSADGKGPGDVIASCKPRLVVQPWTEDPLAQPDAEAPVAAIDAYGGQAARGFTGTLARMQSLAAQVDEEVRRMYEAREGQRRSDRERELEYLGGDAIPNRSAIENLMSMGPNRYVHFGSRSGLEALLPGVRVHVLGPPTIKQSREILKQRRTDDEQFWHLQEQALVRRVRPDPIFPGAPHLSADQAPSHARWFVRRVDGVRGRELLQIVRALDKAMNNTSVILLFEVGRRKLLFPGDAQYENWMYALSRRRVRALLEDVDLYKVGHHGSLNATPKTLWNLFRRRSAQAGAPDRLRTVVSTREGAHGERDSGTEVPRETLIKALETESDFVSTQSVPVKDLYKEIVIEV